MVTPSRSVSKMLTTRASVQHRVGRSGWRGPNRATRYPHTLATLPAHYAGGLHRRERADRRGPVCNLGGYSILCLGSTSSTSLTSFRSPVASATFLLAWHSRTNS